MSGILGAGTYIHSEDIKSSSSFQNENTVMVIYSLFLQSGKEYCAWLKKVRINEIETFSENFIMDWLGGVWSDVDILMEYGYNCS